MAFLYIWIFLGLLIIGTPIVFVMLLAPGLTLIIEDNTRFLNLLVQRLFAGMDSFPLMALPFFILAGELMTAGGVTSRIVKFAETFVAHRKAGLGQVSVSSSIMLAGGSGSAVADASALGGVMIPGMHQAGYTKSFSAAITAASAVLASIIPPSGLMILYAFIMNVSVAAMFAASIIPGLIIGFGLMVVVAVVARFRSFPDPAPRADWSETWKTGKSAFLPLLTPIILIGGIVGGIFTPTEGAAVAAFYALILGVFITREISLPQLFEVFSKAALKSAIILLLVGAAVSFASLVSLKGTPQLVSGFILNITTDPLMLFLVVVLFLLAIGTIMDAGPAILILAPILAPVLIGVGIHPIHFAVVMCITLIIGLITPPLGLVLFVVSGISGERIERISWDLIPYFLFEVAVVVALVLFPELVMWLPRQLGYV
ncbi:TRAP transporter large permease [Roseinatronobacter bogoriensis]|uniref:TRAP transporter large permease protein n=1 Tax=Roseinatronobacter bogoriensis subsp. barguzinensis TaxID=441209 RepID=A0A2K8KCW1_9RHOB|nr:MULTISPECIES: TRAP transporter large permease [Rhodobaca]ATX67282.1 TRAP transporter large permease [Rhodobaca barguzinensis]MBB4206838.1 tripartite ATP-independent transporter DctM subunit [Rhodobaca bogoriensis DSM 18756]TDW41582.1 tripartite ATP-independent transporter DctM subunit [Rhodobaca barguzinensis]TDY74240.1 tripartite ATP-independent transporter DctM subunit [Rhodobaca bogoriensis DSM 18756]